MTKFRRTLWVVSALTSALIAAGCGSNSGGGGGGSSQASSNVKISGVVSVSGSGTSATKPRYKSVLPPSSDPTRAGQKGSWSQLPNLDSDAYALLQAASTSTASAVPLANATVDVFDVNHPEWVFPIARETSDSTGNFTISTLKFAAENGDSYVTGDPIPPGQYTIVATGIHPVTGKKTVAMQSVAQDFSGTTTGTSLVTQSSTVKPTVITMFGVDKNTDGTQTWGNSSVQLPANAGIPITFSVPMRPAAFFGADLTTATDDGVVVKTGVTQVEGTWSFSADWMTAIFTPAAALTDGATYTVTVVGSDTTTAIEPVYNVYDKELALTAVGTFSAVAADGSAPIISYSPTAAATGVTVDTPIRVYSNEPLNPLKLKLSATPSVGAHPGVTFIGETTTVAGKPYTYEFVLGTALTVNGNYTATISGIVDAAGNAANSEMFTFSTETTSAGISGTADTAAIKLAVKTVFGKWVGAMNDHNISSLTGLMSGEFVMEYDMASKGDKGGTGYSSEDLNRDGVYDLDEFTTMINNVFGYWAYCGTTMSGEIQADPLNPGAGPVINVSGNTADFEFKLLASSTIVTQDCSDVAPKESLFLTLELVNGSWKIVRASEGVDTRGQTVHQADYLKLNLPATGFVFSGTSMQTMGAQLFSFEKNANASAYVVMFYDVREPQVGMAVAIPPNENEFTGNGTTGTNGVNYAGLWIPPDNIKFDSVYANVSTEFGFWSKNFKPREGSTLGWQVFALGTATVADLRGKLCQGGSTSTATSCTPQNVNVVSDVIAVSEQRTVTMPGIYKEMTVTVSTTSALQYDELMHGYNAGAANTVDVTVVTHVNSGMPPSGGSLSISGSSDHYFSLFFSCMPNTPVANIDECTATQVGIPLDQGLNDVRVSDGTGILHATDNPACAAANPDPQMCDHSLKQDFRIKTTGGTPPVITLTNVTDDLSNDLTTAVNAGYVQTTGAKTISIAGSVNTAYISPPSTLYLRAWSETYQASTEASVAVDPSGNFTISGFKIYQGFNWIEISGYSVVGGIGVQQHARFGLKETTTGSVYVPPIDITVTAMDNETVVADKKGQFMNVNVTEPDYTGTSSSDTAGVVIKGKMVYATDPNNPSAKPQYNLSSEGGWQGGELTVAADGSFTLNVPLYNGGNNIWFSDANWQHWYGLNIYTESGKFVSKPIITSIDGTAYNTTTTNKIQPGQRIVPVSGQCSATLSGTADVGMLNVNWNGSDGNMGYYWDQQSLNVIDDGVANDGRGSFTVTVPLVSTAAGGSWPGYNGVDIADANWRWTHVDFDMPATSCTFTPATFTTLGNGTIADVKPLNGTTAGSSLLVTNAQTWSADYTTDGSNLWSGTGSIADNNVRISGGYSRDGAAIAVDTWACGAMQSFTATVSAGSWSIDLPAYNGMMNYSIHAGSTWFNANVPVANSNYAVPVLNVTGVDARTATSVGTYTYSTGAVTGSVTNNTYAGACGDLQLGVGAATSLVITGKTKSTGSAEKGSYSIEGSGASFDIAADGTFTLTVTGLLDGMNNIDLNDAKWNHFHIGVMTTNGVPRPQYVKYTGIGANATADQTVAVAAGAATVTGVIYSTPSGTTGSFTANNVTANVTTCDLSNNCTYGWYSSDPLMVDAAHLITKGTSGSDTTFSFDITSTGGLIALDVNSDGMDQAGMMRWHYAHTEFNNGCTANPCWGNWYNKPGSKSKSVNNGHSLDGFHFNRRLDEFRHRPRITH